MEPLSLSQIFMLIATIFMTYTLFNELYKRRNLKVLILRINNKRSLLQLFFWIAIIFLYSFTMLNREVYDLDNLLVPMLFIEASLINIIKWSRGSEISENGIYHNGFLYKWKYIKSYSWVLDSRLKVSTKYTSFIIDIKEELKSEIENSLQKYISIK